VDNRAEVREFLISRRAKITTEQAGMPHIGARRVPGLRRGEVAALAGVSVEYYSKLERGAIAGVSASVLDAIAPRWSSTTPNGPPVPPRPRRRRHQRWHATPPPPRQALDT
jgi:transcriptional regulator with XRE-family HTH domain